MHNLAGKSVHASLFILGLVLMVAGIATQTRGAPVIGLIVAAVNYQLLYKAITAQGATKAGRAGR